MSHYRRSKDRASTIVGDAFLYWSISMLLDLARTNEADDLGLGAVGGILHGPLGKQLPVVTIWIVHHAELFSRLVTAYPRKSR